MKKFIILLFLILLATACTPNNSKKDTDNVKLSLIGFFPQNRNNFSAEELNNFWKDISEYSEIYFISTTWEDTKIIFDSIKNTSRTEIGAILGFESFESLNSNVEKYIETAKKILKEERVLYLSIGNEINFVKLLNDSGFDDFVENYQKIYQELKKDFPSKTIFSNFNYEFLKGSPVLSGMENEYEFDLIQKFTDYSDAIGFTLYPHLNFPHPDQIETQYFDELKNLNKAIIITETGWPTRNKFPEQFQNLINGGFDSSELEQSLYLEKIYNLSKEIGIPIVSWFSYHDVSDWKTDETPDVGLLSYDSTGLKYYNGDEKLIFNKWKELVD